MPSKTIYDESARRDRPEGARPPAELVITWRAGQDCQVGIRTPEEDVPGGHHHFVDYWYGDAPTLTRIGQLLCDMLQGAGPYDAPRGLHFTLPDFTTPDEEVEYKAFLGRTVLNAVTGSSPHDGTSHWVTLNRNGLQALVRFGRQARDAVFGRDE